MENQRMSRNPFWPLLILRQKIPCTETEMAQSPNMLCTSLRWHIKGIGHSYPDGQSRRATHKTGPMEQFKRTSADGTYCRSSQLSICIRLHICRRQAAVGWCDKVRQGWIRGRLAMFRGGQGASYSIFNRPGVAGAVLQTPPWWINWLTD